MKRTIIHIDEALCNGCGDCVTGCHEGALQLIEGKAVLVGEVYCDGLGACIGECPVGAIKLEEREAEPYNEASVMERIVPKGKQVIKAHLHHLQEHGQTRLLREALAYLVAHDIEVDLDGNTADKKAPLACGCPGSASQSFAPAEIPPVQAPALSMVQRSSLTHFPVQLHLINPQASFFAGSDLLLASDCSAFASGEFHSRFLKDKTLAIACPKLDSNMQQYVQKLTQLIDGACINTLTVLIMEVPCCGGLQQLALQAREQASRHIPIKIAVLSVRGQLVSEAWM